ncbi:MAG TPA: tetratricopeptide repeat protein [Rhodocyclaceae bacterium]
MAPAPARPIAVAPPATIQAVQPPAAETASSPSVQAQATEAIQAAPAVRRPAPAPVASAELRAVKAANVEARRPRPSSGGASTGAQQIAVTFGTSQLDAALSMGYSALNRGDLDAATIAYQEALRIEPRQLDALLGLSAIAAHKGEVDRAAAGYFRVLEIDPRNPSAHVGLLGLGATGDVNPRESRLRSLLSQQPVGGYEAGMLQFGLGNLYASQRRWSDAQQAFFSAHASDAGNPDYLYNLAISLDHLQQHSLALRHYQAARSAAESRPGTFDRRDLDARIAELSR